MMRKPISCALALLLLVTSASAENMDVPLDIQLPLLLKVMSYDQRPRPGGFYVAVAYSSTIPLSVKVREAVMPTVTKLRLAAIDDKPVSWTFVDVAKAGELGKLLKTEAVTAVYVTPGLKGQIAEIVRICQEAQVATVTGVSAYVSEGLSVAIGEEEGKPKIVVNLSASRAEGSSFPSSLLGLARVIR